MMAGVVLPLSSLSRLMLQLNNMVESLYGVITNRYPGTPRAGFHSAGSDGGDLVSGSTLLGNSAIVDHVPSARVYRGAGRTDIPTG